MAVHREDCDCRCLSAETELRVRAGSLVIHDLKPGQVVLLIVERVEPAPIEQHVFLGGPVEGDS